MDKRRKTKNILSYIFLTITLIGSLGVGVIFALSEVAYQDIGDFFMCPLWYQIFAFVSLGVSIGGVVGCAFYKDQKNTEKRDLYIVSGMVLACLFMGTFAFGRAQSTIRDILLYIFNFLLPIAFFFYWCIIIGRCKRPFEDKNLTKNIENGCVPDNNAWNHFIEDQMAFNYGNALYPQKISFLTYQLYSCSASGTGFEGFFNTIDSEPFSKNDIRKTLFRDNFFSPKLKNLVCGVLKNYRNINREEQFAHYERFESHYLVAFEHELFNACVWLSYNEWLFAPDLLQNAMPEAEKLYLSKDYGKRIIIRKSGDVFTYKIEEWIFGGEDDFSGDWYEITYSHSFYDSVENVISDIQNVIKDYIEIL